MVWKAAIVREPAASRGSSTGRTKAGQMAAGTAHARWGRQTLVYVHACACLCVHAQVPTYLHVCEFPTSSICHVALIHASVLFAGM